MSQKFNKAIFTRIILGYLLGLSLMIGIMILASVRLNKINHTVENLTGRLANTRELSSDIVNRTLKLRFYAEQYTRTEKYSQLLAVNTEIDGLRSTLEKIQNLTLQSEQKKEINLISRLKKEIDKKIKTISGLIMNRQLLLATEFKKQELIIENELSAIRVNVNELRQRKVYLSFGNILESFHVMQLNHIKYITEDDEKYFVLFKKHYQYFDREFLYLKKSLKGTSILLSLEKARKAVETYYQTFLIVRNSSVKLRKLNRSLRKIEDEIIIYASTVDNKVKQTYHTHNQLTQDLITITQWVLFVSIILAIILSIGLSLLVARKIMTPLLKNLEKQVAQKTLNLEAQNRKNIQMLETIEHQNLKLQRADKLKDEFLANTSHELKTPLHGIIGLANSLIQGAAGDLMPVVIKNLQMIIQSGKRLENLVNDILDFYKMKHQELALKISPVDLYTIAEHVIAISTPLAQTKPIQLSHTVSTTLPLIKGDEDRIQQVLFNLIGNAIKFTQKGEINLSATEKNGEILISVKDTGIGIPLDQQDKIFHSFEQIDGAADRQYNGTGLGLAIAKQFVELHQGTLSVSSMPHKGSTFTFNLPIAEDQAALKRRKSNLPSINKIEFSPVEFQTPEPSTGEGKTIMIVDDEPVNLQILFNYLSLKDYKVTTASSGKDALQQIENNKPDLVLLDVMMPNMNGYKVCQAIRKQYSPIELPIIFLTAKNQINDLLKGYTVGGNDYLSKPFLQEELMARSETQLKLSELNTELQKINVSLEKKVDERTIELKEKNIQISTQDHQKKTMLHMLCHDLINPIGTASSFLEMTKEMIENHMPTLKKFGIADLEELTDYSLASLNSAHCIINSVRELLAVNEGKLALELAPMNLKKLLETSLRSIELKFKEKKLEFLNQVSDAVYVWVDSTYFVNSVLSNLLSNACKFSHKGQSIIIQSYQDAPYTVLQIIDKGIGIPPHLLENIFSLTVKTSRLGTEEEVGTGYGMPLVKEVIEASGGKIEIFSQEKDDRSPNPAGTTIKIFLKSQH